MDEGKINGLKEECKQIEQDCLYTAQAHFVLAERYEKRMRRYIIWPAAAAAVFSLVSTIWPDKLGPAGYVATLLSGLAAISAGLGMERAVSAHKQAANLLTALRHEARRLHETWSTDLTPEQFAQEVRQLCERYDSYVVALEVTDKKAFEEARKLIKDGVFDPD